MEKIELGSKYKDWLYTNCKTIYHEQLVKSINLMMAKGSSIKEVEYFVAGFNISCVLNNTELVVVKTIDSKYGVKLHEYERPDGSKVREVVDYESSPMRIILIDSLTGKDVLLK